MNVERMAIIRRLTREATEIVEAVFAEPPLHGPEAIEAMTMARTLIDLAQLHVAMGDWPISDEPA
jgi:hypothetical protein